MFISLTLYRLPIWYAEAGEPKIQPGHHMGLTLMLDGHSDLTAGGSVESDYEGFVALVSNRGSVPFSTQKVIEVKSYQFT